MGCVGQRPARLSQNGLSWFRTRIRNQTSPSSVPITLPATDVSSTRVGHVNSQPDLASLTTWTTVGVVDRRVPPTESQRRGWPSTSTETQGVWHTADHPASALPREATAQRG